MEKAKQVTWRLLAAGVCLLTVSSVARADSLDEQRSRYAQIKQAWDNRQMDVVEQMMPGLKDYPLARCNLVSSMNWRGVKTGVAC